MVRLLTVEDHRLEEARLRKKHWKRWGPYLSERQWGTVREDYSANGTAWEYFPFEHAHLRTYRWGEDGLGGISDRHQMICFGLALWNGKDPILKERLFGLTGNQGNHGEDVKEQYYYVDATPTHSYLKFLHKYPHRAFPYALLREERRRRSRDDPAGPGSSHPQLPDEEALVQRSGRRQSGKDTNPACIDDRDQGRDQAGQR
jgi:hypothetical protein